VEQVERWWCHHASCPYTEIDAFDGRQLPWSPWWWKLSDSPLTGLRVCVFPGCVFVFVYDAKPAKNQRKLAACVISGGQVVRVVHSEGSQFTTLRCNRLLFVRDPTDLVLDEFRQPLRRVPLCHGLTCCCTFGCCFLTVLTHLHTPCSQMTRQSATKPKQTNKPRTCRSSSCKCSTEGSAIR
jgi:hypothetical protein